MKNIFIEGLQGSGKSTLLQTIANQTPELKICREGDYSPVDLAWCTWMTEKEYLAMLDRYVPIADEIKAMTFIENNHYIVTYTRIITDIPNFHKDLERFEIYNGRKPLQDTKKIILSRYQNFHDTGYLLECAFFQNIVEDLILFHQLSDDEIIAFYRELYDIMPKDNFLLLYLRSDNLEENIRTIKEERSDNQGNELWYQLMLRYLVTSPHGRQCGYADFNDMITHLRHRQQLELRIIDEVLGGKAIVLPSKQYAIDEIMNLIQ